MSRHVMVRFAALGAVLLLPLSAQKCGHAAADVAASGYGPPFLSLEVPPNPMRPDTRDAALLIHVFHHGSPAGYKIQGRAEGLVDGERRTIQLDLDETSDPGLYAVEQQWPSDGNWVLAIEIAEHAEATLIAELGPDGGVTKGRYHSMSPPIVSLRSVRVVSGAVRQTQIDAALNAMARAE
jgi:hypothetical protein